MNGAKTEPCEKTSKPPNSTKKNTMGNNHHFFLTFKKFQNSFMVANFDMEVLFNHVKMFYKLSIVLGKFFNARVRIMDKIGK